MLSRSATITLIDKPTLSLDTSEVTLWLNVHEVTSQQSKQKGSVTSDRTKAPYFDYRTYNTLE